MDSISKDVEWICGEKPPVYFASNYFDDMYECALKLIRKGKAYVCDLSAEEIREYRGTLKEPGKDSPYRNRSVEENLSLFEGMKNGEFEDGSRVLRAKIDMASPNINMRDPVIYRVAHMSHQNTGDNIYTITIQEISGAFIRCMILLIRLRMRLRVLPIRFVHWSLRIIVRFMTGL